MKILFSEANPDYTHYLFPYAVWALPEHGETPADLLGAGFLPASRDLNRFYLCRQVRIDLARFSPSSENRRILRKCPDIHCHLVPRAKFDYSAERRQAFKHYADIKFGKDVMTLERLDNLFHGRIISHLLLFTDITTHREVGTVSLFLQPPRAAFYYYAFYDLNYYQRNLGIFMMTSAVAHFAQAQIQHLYLGSVYSRNALYKTQFAGAQFFNGFRWSEDLSELKFLLERDSLHPTRHLLESDDYLDKFHPGGLPSLAATAGMSVPIPPKHTQGSVG